MSSLKGNITGNADYCRAPTVINGSDTFREFVENPFSFRPLLRRLLVVEVKIAQVKNHGIDMLFLAPRSVGSTLVGFPHQTLPEASPTAREAAYPLWRSTAKPRRHVEEQ
jgi:hypothetical protein